MRPHRPFGRVAMLSSSALLALAFSNPASAEAISETAVETAAYEEAGASYDGDDIVVRGEVLYSDQINAVKTPTPILDVPQSLTITTQEEIQLRGFTSIGEIIDYTPGVSMSQGEGHRDAIVFRGIRSTADFFIDGVRDDVQYYRGLYNLEQVEILRGPNALLFGRGGTGGVLNRVTKKGKLGENFSAGQIAIDTFGAFDVQADVNFAASENVAVRVNAAYENLDNHRDFYDGERIGLNPTARIKLSEATVLDLSYEYADHDRFIDRGIPTGADGRPVEEFREIVFGDPELNFDELEAHLLRANLNHQFSENVKGNFAVFFGDYDKVYSNFYASSYDQLGSPDVVTLDGYIDTTQRQNLILSGSLVSEFGTGSVNHTLLIGGEYISTDSDQDRLNPVWSSNGDDTEEFTIARPLQLRGGSGVLAPGDPAVAAFNDLNDFTQVDIEVFSLFIQDEIELTDWLNIVVGGRFDSFDFEVFDVPANATRSRKDEKFSPRGGIIFKPMENISVYTSYSESFLPRSGEQFANISDTTAALDPDEFVNLEAGIKWDFDQGLSLTAAVFEIEQSSPQPNDNDPETLDVIDSKIQGFEVQLQGEVMDGWFISAGYSYLDGEQVNRQGPTGLRPRELPENMFSIWNNVQVTDKLGLGFGLTHQDESFINNGNSAVLPAYTRVDAAIYYNVSENLRFQVNVENLTDTLYFPSSHSTHQATVGAPLNARFAISGRF